jgi:hypothetical protein
MGDSVGDIDLLESGAVYAVAWFPDRLKPLRAGVKQLGLYTAMLTVRAESFGSLNTSVFWKTQAKGRSLVNPQFRRQNCCGIRICCMQTLGFLSAKCLLQVAEQNNSGDTLFWKAVDQRATPPNA